MRYVAFPGTEYQCFGQNNLHMTLLTQGYHASAVCVLGCPCAGLPQDNSTRLPEALAEAGKQSYRGVPLENLGIKPTAIRSRLSLPAVNTGVITLYDAGGGGWDLVLGLVNQMGLK